MAMACRLGMAVAGKAAIITNARIIRLLSHHLRNIGTGTMRTRMHDLERTRNSDRCPRLRSDAVVRVARARPRT